MNQIQELAIKDVPILPLGEYFSRTAFRKSIGAVLPGSAAFFWKMRKAAA